MPYTPAFVVKQILENRHRIRRYDDILILCRILFNLALRDVDAAEELLKEPNSIVQAIPYAIPKDKLIEFAKTHKVYLVKKLIVLADLKEQLAIELMQARNEKQVQDPVRKILLDLKQQDDMGRTRQAIKYNPLITKRDKVDGIMIGDEFVPMVTREIRDFNTKLCSIGSATKREVILLDPKDPMLNTLYEQLKSQLSSTANIETILNEVKQLTRDCFLGQNPDNFIQTKLDNGQKIISLSDFIQERQGVCRHHTLLNSYFLSRLVHDGLLKGEVIHHRQNFPQSGAHTWNIFRNQDGKVYSLDSLWNDLTCITDKPGTINSLYGHDVEAKINEMHFASTTPAIVSPSLKQKESFFLDFLNNQGLQPKNLSSIYAEKIIQLKNRIENTHFSVGNYFLWKGGVTLKLENGEEKRVPHGVYAIYQLIITNHPDSVTSSDPQKSWNDIRLLAEKALNSPRPGRASSTTTFYHNILTDYTDLPLNDLESPSAHKHIKR